MRAVLSYLIALALVGFPRDMSRAPRRSEATSSGTVLSNMPRVVPACARVSTTIEHTTP